MFGCHCGLAHNLISAYFLGSSVASMVDSLAM